MKITNRIHINEQSFEIPIAPDRSIPRKVYFYLIEGEKLYMIDTGTKTSFESISQYLNQIGRDIDELAAIFLTHTHPDHIGAVAELVQKTKCKVYCHSSERSWIEDINLQFKERPVPGFFNLVGGSAKIDSFVHHMERIELEADLTLRVFHTPGHSDGSVCYQVEEERALCIGDALLLPGEMPIYTNLEAYTTSLATMNSIDEAEIYLSAWDQPKSKAMFRELVIQSQEYIELIGTAVGKCKNVYSTVNPMEFCKAVVTELGLPPFLANTLLLKSFEAHLK